MGTPRETGAGHDPEAAAEPGVTAAPAPPVETTVACGEAALHAADAIGVAQSAPTGNLATELETAEGGGAETDVPMPPPPGAPDENSAEQTMSGALADAAPPDGAPAPVVEPSVSPANTPMAGGDDPPVPSSDTFYLEEIVLPSAIAAPTPLPEGTTIGPAGSVLVEQLLDTRGRINRYRASVRQDADPPVQ